MTNAAARLAGPLRSEPWAWRRGEICEASTDSTRYVRQAYGTPQANFCLDRQALTNGSQLVSGHIVLPCMDVRNFLLPLCARMDGQIQRIPKSLQNKYFCFSFSSWSLVAWSVRLRPRWSALKHHGSSWPHSIRGALHLLEPGTGGHVRTSQLCSAMWQTTPAARRLASSRERYKN